MSSLWQVIGNDFAYHNRLQLALLMLSDLHMQLNVEVNHCKLPRDTVALLQIAHWLSVPGHGLKQYGDELRPCKLTMHVKGFVPSKNDFLFERRLNDHVYSIVREYSKGKPALVFCR